MTPPTLRMTQAMQQVIRALLQEPTRQAYGGEICRAAGLPSGTVTPILARLENAGILESEFEDVDPSDVGRPRRKFYAFTTGGAELARHELARAYRGSASAFAARPGLAGGTP